MSARRHTRSSGAARPRLIALAAAVLLVVGIVPAASVQRSRARDAGDRTHGCEPTVQYEEAMAHAADKIAFAPGGSRDGPIQAAQGGSLGGRWRCTHGAAGRPAVRQGDPRAAAQASRVAPARAVGGGRAGRLCPIQAARTSWHADLAAAVDPGGLKREVFGFLPYWELTDSSTRLDWEKLSTIAYFGVGAAGDGHPPEDEQRRLDDGRLERLDELEDDRRHQRRPRQWRAGRADRAELRLVLDRA